MGVRYILREAGNRMGLNPSDASQRATLVRFLNTAAIQVYIEADIQDSLDEKTFKINGDQTISFPEYLGELRAVREFYSYIPWHINKQRPRYNASNWQDIWRNCRLIRKQALQASIRNESVITFTTKAVETQPVVITITGSTPNAASISENVVMDAVSKSTVNNFLTVEAVVKNRINDYNITATDVDGMQLTMIPNNRIDCSYLIVDISLLPFLNQNVNKQAHYLEIQYKRSLPWLQNDGQEFPGTGYDDAIVDKMCQVWLEQQGKTEAAVSMDAKVTRTMGRIHQDRNVATEDVVAFVPNGHDQLLAKNRNNRPGNTPSIYPYGVGQ